MPPQHADVPAEAGFPGFTASRGRRHLVAAAMGNVLEYYDFVVYAFLATVIARRFFPNESELAGLLATFGAFGAGFLARPIGGAIIGRLADRRGRRVALLISVFGMAVGTVGIGLLPTFDSIGSLASVLLVSLRLLQGLCAGGGWGSATAFIIESAPPARRGFYGAIGQASITSSTLLGSIVAAVVNAAFSPDQVDRWAWRIPFLLGVVLLPVGLYMRRTIAETPAFARTPRGSEAQRDRRGAFGLTANAFGFTVIWTVSFYVMLSYMPTFTARYAGLTPTQALWSNAAALAVMVATIPLFGLLSDRIGRKPLLLACCVGFALLSYPLVPSHIGRCIAVLDLRGAGDLQPVHRGVLGRGSCRAGRALSDALPHHAHVDWLQPVDRHLRRLCAVHRDVADRRDRLADLPDALPHGGGGRLRPRDRALSRNGA